MPHVLERKRNFPNLKAFSAESGIEDIGALSEMTKLEALYLGTYDVVAIPCRSPSLR